MLHFTHNGALLTAVSSPSDSIKVFSYSLESMGTLNTVILVGLVAILLRAWLPKTLPHPYESIPIQPLSRERVARMHRALNYSKSEEWLNNTEKRSLSDNLEILFNGTVMGAESVGIRPLSKSSNQLVMLDKFGYLHLAQPNGEYLMKETEPLPYLGPGRPLGFEFLDKDTLIVADSLKGLVQVKFHESNQGTLAQSDVDVSILTNTLDGSIINYVNDLDIDHRHQRVYFTSSSQGVVAFNSIEGHYDTMRSYMLNMYSADVSGRLLMYNIRTRETILVMDDIWYANGVTLSPKLDYVLVVETCGFRVIRKWLKGNKNGIEEDFITNLPGFPDGITRSSDGNYWISLVAPISPLLKFIEPIGARYVMSLLNFELDMTKHFLKQWGCVLKVSPEGAILNVLIDPDGSSVSSISAVTEHDGKLFLGNLGGSFVAVIDLSSNRK